MNAPPENFVDWLPVRVYWQENRAFVDWCCVGKEHFREPFFDQTIERLFRQPFNLLFRHQTPIEFLGELSERLPALAPTGFIFHLSRCGSTLISQMLAALDRNIVMSEPPPVDSVLRANLKNRGSHGRAARRVAALDNRRARSKKKRGRKAFFR